MESSAIANLLDQIRQLRQEGAGLESFRPVGQVMMRLDRALNRGQKDDPVQRPLHLVLLGGTGVGKSRLFNALVGQPEASPTSDAQRCFTDRPHVARHPSEAGLVQIPQELSPVFIDSKTPGVVLCDTPDIDGMLVKNWEVTRRVMDLMDLVIYVADPDKRSNFCVAEKVYRWALCKRWFFVLNKVDMHEEILAEMRQDFDRRLRELGFEPQEDTRFLVSAVDLQRFDGPRLRQALFQLRPEEQRLLLRWDALAGDTLHALAGHLLEEIRRKGEKLLEREKGLQVQVRDAYVACLQAGEVAQAFRQLIREAAWHALSLECGAFLHWPIWLRNRFSAIYASYQISRWMMGNPSLFGLMGILTSSLWAALRSSLPLRRIALAMGPTYRQRMQQIRNDARRILEDEGVEQLADMDPVEEVPASNSTPPAATTSSGVAGFLENILHHFWLRGTEEEIVTQLEKDIEHLGMIFSQRIMKGIGSWLIRTLGNLLPLGMLGWIGYRLIRAWYDDAYLDYRFYLMALVLFLLSLLPGVFLLSVRLRRQLAKQDMTALVQHIEEPQATQSLRQVARRLDHFATQASRLVQQVQEYRRILLQEGLSPALFGTAPLGSESTAQAKIMQG